MNEVLLEKLRLQEFRKTNYIRPHEYIVDFWNPELFKLMKDLIEKHGYEKNFYSRAYRYINIGQYKYWIIDEILNRELLSIEKEYEQNR